MTADSEAKPATVSQGPYRVGEKPEWVSRHSLVPVKDAEGKIVCYVMNRGASSDLNAELLARAWTYRRALEVIAEHDDSLPARMVANNALLHGIAPLDMHDG